MKAVALVIVGSIALQGFAENTATVQPQVQAKKPTAGIVEKPGSQKGVFTFINTQSDLARKEIENVAKQVEKELQIKAVVSDAKPGDAATLVKASGGALGLVVVSNDETPALLIAPEDGWGVVNVKKLDKFATPASRAKSYADRCRREIMRGFACVACGTGSSYSGNICSITRIEDLETAGEGLPNDKLIAAKRFLASRGYSPLIRAPYFIACKQGWAPEPTNDLQRAVWNRVHEIPSDPIKIKYDPKRDK